MKKIKINEKNTKYFSPFFVKIYKRHLNNVLVRKATSIECIRSMVRTVCKLL